ncbi:hypothetical protein [Chlorobium sp. KB01]|uniref:hypothetical protein n=1 Tax=Chlorobium sp. KB01 TaxID=1917528 RepID=UPI000976E3FB|nr:hypothetical protein [Chlorobium sp. KB01]
MPFDRQEGKYLTFIAASGTGGVDAVYADENIWLTRKMMGVLYDVATHTINYHLKKFFQTANYRRDGLLFVVGYVGFDIY